jgi:hypothetical protein
MTLNRVLAVWLDRHGTGREAGHAALFPISNESSYGNAHARFLDAWHIAGIVAASSAIFAKLRNI